MFDGWSENRFHFVGTFVLGAGKQAQRWQRLISFTVITLDHVHENYLDGEDISAVLNADNYDHPRMSLMQKHISSYFKMCWRFTIRDLQM